MTDTLKTADIVWKEDHNGCFVPASRHFDDIYFSKAGGLSETHHVFINGNQLIDRFGRLSDDQRFIIAETGFGTGLNFLAVCQLWQKLAPKSARLHFISTEKYPLSRDDFARALSVWCTDDGLSDWVDALIESYPLPLAGCHRLYLSERITLDLWFGEALDSLNEIANNQHEHSARIDAWFLDGFAPAKNSDMWSDDLFKAMARISHSQTTVATFTAAGFVRRGLIDAGFDMIKSAGFGRKRQMLCTAPTPNQPTLSHDQADFKPKKIAIIGGGISGVSAANALSCRGHEVHLFEPDAIMTGASGNPCALFAPKLTLLDHAATHLPTVSFLYSYRHYNAMKLHSQIFDHIGVLDFLLPSQKTVKKRQALIDDYPKLLISTYHPQKDSSVLSQDLLQTEIVAHIPMGGILYPANIAASLKDHFIHHPYRVTQIHERENGVDLTAFNGENDQNFSFDQVVIAAGFASHFIDDRLFNCRKIRGQVTWLALTNNDDPHQPTQAANAIKYDGYSTEFFDPKTQSRSLLFGASFIRNSTDTTVNDDEHFSNFQKFSQALPNYCHALNISKDANFKGRVGIRAQTPDYHPLVGKLANSSHIFCLYGMGSKGFSFAPFCAEVLADMMDGGILPASSELSAKLSPNRDRLKTPIQEKD